MNDFENFEKSDCLLGTLGNNLGNLTCSMHVGAMYKKCSGIVPYSSFEEAAEALKLKRISVLLVPAAYNKICDFIMDEDLTITDFFLEKTPAIVLVGKQKNVSLDDVKQIYLHHATNYLLKDIFDKKIKFHYVQSNIESCISLMKDNYDSNLAITNKKCAEYFKLSELKVLRDSVVMPWVCFEKSKEGGPN